MAPGYPKKVQGTGLGSFPWRRIRRHQSILQEAAEGNKSAWWDGFEIVVCIHGRLIKHQTDVRKQEAQQQQKKGKAAIFLSKSRQKTTTRYILYASLSVDTNILGCGNLYFIKLITIKSNPS